MDGRHCDHRACPRYPCHLVVGGSGRDAILALTPQGHAPPNTRRHATNLRRPEQKAQLLEILVEERGRMHTLAASSANASNRGTYAFLRVDYDEDYERRVRDRAALVLSPIQLRQFNRGRTLDHMMRRLNSWIARATTGR
jgi:hypothetical protein